MSAGFAAKLSPELGIAFRRCHITDGAIDQRATETGATRREIVEVKLPDRGSVMAGDFGEGGESVAWGSFGNCTWRSTRRWRGSRPMFPRRRI
jgi:hypothetical protein